MTVKSLPERQEALHHPMIPEEQLLRFGEATLWAADTGSTIDDFAWLYVGDLDGQEPLPPIIRDRKGFGTVVYDQPGDSWFTDAGTLIYTRKTAQIFPLDRRGDMISEHWFVATTSPGEGTVEHLDALISAVMQPGLTEQRINLGAVSILSSSREGFKLVRSNEAPEELRPDVRVLLKGINAHRAMRPDTVTITG